MIKHRVSVGLGLEDINSLPDDVMLNETETIFILNLEGNTVSQEDEHDYETIKERNKIYIEVSFIRNQSSSQTNNFSWIIIDKEMICIPNVVCKHSIIYQNMNVSTPILSWHEFVSSRTFPSWHSHLVSTFLGNCMGYAWFFHGSQSTPRKKYRITRLNDPISIIVDQFIGRMSYVIMTIPKKINSKQMNISMTTSLR